MKRGLKNICLSLIGFSASPILTACYGIIPYDEPYLFDHISGHVVDKELKPIEGIEVSNRFGSTQTNQEGYFAIDIDDSSSMETLMIKDIDGPLGGGEFLPQEVTITEDNFNNICIILEEKE